MLRKCRYVPVYEAKTRFSELLAAVEHGEQVIITRRGRAVARIVPTEEPPESTESRRARVAGTFARLRELRQGLTLDMDVRQAIEDGRD
ncbi:type II toxin-antitoxin system Phd/YefM family antitoxin [Aromatoleum aromaticum]|uniref:type II toxin-antitoxin system Phd/YefM family antitoxin n=1 Tax=Aromatoleum aromaticum TaxID=551760 RepID=UPI0014598689|nr:type II toxin-antitoxin system prevent-host-death family antitoxin [Aromatoleum aromaticum]NMG56753.1 type II toxin-antitoxin system prevent-host-death family antitoxin [Aromatoleum aromaticum]